MHWIYQFHSKNHLKLSTLVGLCHLFKDVLICSWENSADRWIYSPRECGTRNGKKCKALGTEQVCWNTKLHLFCLFRTMRLCAYIQNVVYVSIWTIYIYYICMMKNCIYTFWLTYPTTAKVSACFSSHAWGASCLKSWNRTQIDKQIPSEKNGNNKTEIYARLTKKWQK